MSPNAIVTCFLMMLPILLLSLVALFYSRKRSVFLALTLFISTTEVIYLIAEKDAEKRTIIENIDTVERHLRERYPGEQWFIRREEGIALNHGGIEVIFLNELDKGYTYYVEGGKVKQSGGFSKEDADKEWRHYEEES
ncbi:hypothetical protein L2D08_18635 [Domibacillus sp. PGB-M46]|uniref:hypothetical protein n=1 Tax=Domibacillus sp. PGB-M46 TaxID=2910255 RepID=UPI001F563491|nr:hypothetical protein [Domibacillus sp. PGB-M46]MCI2256363.1 hypothetical protein [Domibacillus sp. PGB-M46]